MTLKRTFAESIHEEENHADLDWHFGKVNRSEDSSSEEICDLSEYVDLKATGSPLVSMNTPWLRQLHNELDTMKSGSRTMKLAMDRILAASEMKFSELSADRDTQNMVIETLQFQVKQLQAKLPDPSLHQKSVLCELGPAEQNKLEIPSPTGKATADANTSSYKPDDNTKSRAVKITDLPVGISFDSLHKLVRGGSFDNVFLDLVNNDRSGGTDILV